jgi:hypothetical protein
MQMFCTFFHFVNQHFPGLPVSGTHCIITYAKANTNYSVVRYGGAVEAVYVFISQCLLLPKTCDSVPVFLEGGLSETKSTWHISHYLAYYSVMRIAFCTVFYYHIINVAVIPELSKLLRLGTFEEVCFESKKMLHSIEIVSYITFFFFAPNSILMLIAATVFHIHTAYL